MGWFISIILELFAAAVVLIPIYWIRNKSYYHDTRKAIIYCIFSFYLVAVYALVGPPNITYVRFELNLNLIPVIGMIEDLKNSILNVLLFVPLGAVLPIAWKKFRSVKHTVLFGFGMSFVIEILQIFTFRATDVNDLITNTLGTLLGFGITKLLVKRFPAVKEILSDEKTRELYFICALVFAVMFFVQPFLFSVLWDLFMH